MSLPDTAEYWDDVHSAQRRRHQMLPGRLMGRFEVLDGSQRVGKPTYFAEAKKRFAQLAAKGRKPVMRKLGGRS